MSRLFRIRHFFEKHGFAVSTRLAETLGMKVKSVRLFFYICFFYHYYRGVCIVSYDSILVKDEGYDLYKKEFSF